MNLEIINNISDEEFRLCKNDEDRVKLMLPNVGEFLCVKSKCSYGRKSSEESVKFRNSGNFLLNTTSFDLEEVLKLYSKSILYAPPGSEQLSLAYANRSAILFRGKYYEECLEDISRALETGYPDNLKPKLLLRRVTCNYALTGNVNFETDESLIEIRALIEKLPTTNKIRKMVEDTLNDRKKITSVGRRVKKICPLYKPEVKGRNPLLPGASDAIALRYSEEYGRHLVATRDISSGEVLLMERPYTTFVDDEWIYCICSYCAKRTWNGIPCDYCVHAMFCSTECKLAAWKEYHDIECEIFGFAKEMKILSNGLIGLRITVKAIKEAGSIEALRKRLEELDSIKASDVEISINPNSYETFYIMSDNPERRNPEALLFLSAMAGSLTYSLAVRTNLFGKKVTDSFRVVEKLEHFLFVAGLMLKNIRIAQNRTFGWKAESEIIAKPSGIHTMLPVSSFFNNRCYDATGRYRINEDIILVALVPINKGDQVFTYYYTDYKISPKDVRQQTLKTGWQFDCNCLACKENWSTLTPTSWTEQDLSPRIVKALNNEMRKFKWPSLEEINDPMKMVLLKEQFCQFLNYIYPQVEKPCSNIDLLVYIIDEILIKLSSPVYSRFLKEFSHNDYEECNRELIISILKKMFLPM